MVYFDIKNVMGYTVTVQFTVGLVVEMENYIIILCH